MTIKVYLFYYNDQMTLDNVGINTPVEELLSIIKSFILKSNPLVNYENLIDKWSELQDLFQKHPKILIKDLLKIKKKFKIGYGGNCKFEIEYSSIEEIEYPCETTEEYKPLGVNMIIFISVCSFLSYNDQLNLSLTCREFNKCMIQIKQYNKFFKKIRIPNALITFKQCKSIKLQSISPNSLLLNYFMSNDQKVYVITQSPHGTINITRTMINDKNEQDEQIVYSDYWTHCYFILNTFYQFKFPGDKLKPLINLLGSSDPLKVVQVKCFPNVQISSFYHNGKMIYVINNHMCLYKVLQKAKKDVGTFQMIYNAETEYQKFERFREKCKKREYNQYFLCWKNFYFLSLMKFRIVNMENEDIVENCIKCYPNMKGIEHIITEISHLGFICAKTEATYFFLSINSFEIAFTFESYFTSTILSHFFFQVGIPERTYFPCFIYNLIDNFSIEQKNMIPPIHAKLVETPKQPPLFIWFTRDICSIDISKKLLFERFDNQHVVEHYFNSAFLFIKLFDCQTFQKRKVFQINKKKFMKMTNKKKVDISVIFNERGSFVVKMENHFWFYNSNTNQSLLPSVTRHKRHSLPYSFKDFNNLYCGDFFLWWGYMHKSLIRATIFGEESKAITEIELPDFPLLLFKNSLSQDLFIISEELILYEIFFEEENIKYRSEYKLAITGLLEDEFILHADFINDNVLIIFTSRNMFAFKQESTVYSIILKKENLIDVNLSNSNNIPSFRKIGPFQYMMRNNCHSLFYDISDDLLL